MSLRRVLGLVPLLFAASCDSSSGLGDGSSDDGSEGGKPSTGGASISVGGNAPFGGASGNLSQQGGTSQSGGNSPQGGAAGRGGGGLGGQGGRGGFTSGGTAGSLPRGGSSGAGGMIVTTGGRGGGGGAGGLFNRGGTAGVARGGASYGGGGYGGLPTGGSGGGLNGGAGAGGSMGGVAGEVIATGGTEEPGNPGPPYAFPQNQRSSYCVYPTYAHSDYAKAAYDKWKAELVTSDGANGHLRVRRPGNEDDTTVSEGIGYGMVFAVFMDDQSTFDEFWKYSQGLVNEHGLMNWLIGADGKVAQSGAATDADEDMAWALAMAAQKWGGKGSMDDNYIDLAKAQIGRIWDHEVDHGKGELLAAGDSWGVVFTFNPSYFAPNQYTLFGKLTGNEDGWNRVISRGYEVMLATLTAERGNLDNGLVPAWADEYGNPMAPFDGAPMHYQYDSARIPFRIGQHYCATGDSRAESYLAKTTAFFSAQGADKVVDGYELNGTPKPENTSPAGVQSALFLGAAAVGAMSQPDALDFVDAAYKRLIEQPDEMMLPPSHYFNSCWKVFSLMMMSGNLFDYSQYP